MIEVDEVVIEETEVDAIVVEPASVTDLIPPSEPEPTPTKGKKGRRASVPSWDEILFGAGQGDS